MAKLKLKKEEYEALVPDVQALYTEKDGSFYLNLDGNENAMLALSQERQRADAFESIVKKLGDNDPEELLRIKTEAEKAAKKPKDKEISIDDAVAQALEANNRDWQSKLEAKDKQILGYENTFAEKDVDSLLTSVLTESGVIPKRFNQAKTLLKQEVAYERKDGKTVIKFKDPTTGYALETNPKDFVANWAETNDFLFAAEGKPGTNDSNGGGSFSGKTIKSTDQAAMNANLEKIASGEITVVP